jgi:transcriptional regulator with XRE-family HTH domain
MAGKKSDPGPIGVNVTHTVRHFRKARRLSYAELSRKLADMGREIPSLGLRRIESGERRVDVDDLVGLALALGVSPLALLLPTEEGQLVPEGDRYTAAGIWDWATGKRPLIGDALDFVRDSNPLDWPNMQAAIEELGVGGDLAAGLLWSRSRSDVRNHITETAGRESSRGDDQ